MTIYKKETYNSYRQVISVVVVCDWYWDVWLGRVGGGWRWPTTSCCHGSLSGCRCRSCCVARAPKVVTGVTHELTLKFGTQECISRLKKSAYG